MKKSFKFPFLISVIHIKKFNMRHFGTSYYKNKYVIMYAMLYYKKF